MGRISMRMITVLTVALAAFFLWTAPVSARQAAETFPPASGEAGAGPAAHGATPVTLDAHPEGTHNPAAGSGDVTAAMSGEVASHPHTAAREGREEGVSTPHLPNFVGVLLKLTGLYATPFGHFVHEYELQFFMLLVTGIGIWLLWVASKLRAVMPTRLQAFFEMVYEGLYAFYGGILGKQNLRYVPFVATMFLFVYFQNVAGLIPLMTGGTSAYTTTATLAVIVFFYVQVQGIRAGGFGHWARHFVGNPKDPFGWIMGIAMLPLEIIGTLAKPLSLSLRLFGNTMGEHILVGVFLLMGIGLVSAYVPNTIIGVPLHTPFMFLGLLTTFIQALVFSLLATIYLLLLLPHDDHHEDEMHDHHHDEKYGMRDDHGQHVTAGHISPV